MALGPTVYHVFEAMKLGSIAPDVVVDLAKPPFSMARSSEMRMSISRFWDSNPNMAALMISA
jgi:hypothetical protein